MSTEKNDVTVDWSNASKVGNDRHLDDEWWMFVEREKTRKISCSIDTVMRKEKDERQINSSARRRPAMTWSFGFDSGVVYFQLLDNAVDRSKAKERKREVAEHLFKWVIDENAHPGFSPGEWFIEQSILFKRSETTKTDRIEFCLVMSGVKTSFVLHSKRHRQLYPESRYPLTHVVDRQTVAQRCLHQATFRRRGIYSFMSRLSALTLFVCGFFRTHVYLYNQLLGPFHVDQKALATHVNNYDQNAWLPWRKEYFQVELGEDNIRNPVERRGHDPTLLRSSVAAASHRDLQESFQTLDVRQTAHANSDVFPSSIPVWLSIVHHLDASMCCQTACFGIRHWLSIEWIEKAEYVQFINEEYARNATRFNSLVLSKCGILVGYLYRPVHELAFLPTRDHIPSMLLIWHSMWPERMYPPSSCPFKVSSSWRCCSVAFTTCLSISRFWSVFDTFMYAAFSRSHWNSLLLSSKNFIYWTAMMRWKNN